MDDKSLQDVHINVTSINGVVLLTGEAPTEAQRTKILDHVRVVPRVRRTVNEIRISPATAYSSRMSDTLITTKVKSKMLGDEKLDSLRIKVITEYGVVYLMGVGQKKEAERAAELTRQVGGVQKVVKLFEYTRLIPSTSKIVRDRGQLAVRLSRLPRPYVFTNGCFDILHRGHVAYLEEAAMLGPTLIVAVNSDASVQRLEKRRRPPDQPAGGPVGDSRGAGVRGYRGAVRRRHAARSH